MEATSDATLEAVVARAVDQRADVIEQLVYAELERRVDALVEERLNGHAGGAQLPAEKTNGAELGNDSPKSAEALRKRCTVCGLEKPADRFDKHRRTCKACRHQQERERVQRKAATEADEEPGLPEG